MELLINMNDAIIKSGKTKAQIAREMGLTYNDLWRLLSGNRQIKACMVARLAYIIGKTTDELYGDISKYYNSPQKCR